MQRSGLTLSAAPTHVDLPSQAQSSVVAPSTGTAAVMPGNGVALLYVAAANRMRATPTAAISFASPALLNDGHARKRQEASSHQFPGSLRGEIEGGCRRIDGVILSRNKRGYSDEQDYQPQATRGQFRDRQYYQGKAIKIALPRRATNNGAEV